MKEKINIIEVAISNATPNDRLSESSSEFIKIIALIMPSNCPKPGITVDITVRNTL